MSTSVSLPQLGESVTEGTITRWLKQVGEHVEADEPLVEVSTDKVDTEIPAPVSGTLLSIAAPEDEIVEVGGLLGQIGEAAEASPEEPPEAPSAPAAPSAPEAPSAPATPPAQAPPAPTAPAPATPAPATASSTGTPGEGTPVTLPELGESVTEGTITRWLKAVGDNVQVDEPLVEISTDKVDTEIPSPAAGVLASISAQEDDIVEVGGVLAVISSGAAAPAPPVDQAPPPTEATPVASTPMPQESAPTTGSAPPAPEPQAPADLSPKPATPEPSTPAPATAPVPQSPPPTGGTTDASPPYVTPLVRKIAESKGVDLSTIRGTGVGGRIRRQDVLDAADALAAEQQSKPADAKPKAAPASAEPAVSPLRGNSEKITRLRRVIAERMVDSLQVSAQLTTVVEADVTRIAVLRDQVKSEFHRREGVKLTYLPFFAKAVVEALKRYPVLNSSIDLQAGTITYHDAEHLGMAVDTDRGLLVPVVRDAGELNISGLAHRISDLAERTRVSKVTPDELSGGTFTLTNTGSRGALFDTPIINQPQVAILGTGAVVKRPVVVAGPDGGSVIAIRSMVYLALTYDHRIVDGADAAKFLTSVRLRLEGGEFEGELGL